MKSILIGALLSAMVAGSIGCGSSVAVGSGGRLVGAPCASDSQCDAVCVTEKSYPGGFCTLKCSNDGNCPPGTACIDDAGGICGILCSSNVDCASFGRGFVCDSRSRKGSSGSAPVCRVP